MAEVVVQAEVPALDCGFPGGTADRPLRRSQASRFLHPFLAFCGDAGADRQEWALLFCWLVSSPLFHT